MDCILFFEEASWNFLFRDTSDAVFESLLGNAGWHLELISICRLLINYQYERINIHF